MQKRQKIDWADKQISAKDFTYEKESNAVS